MKSAVSRRRIAVTSLRLRYAAAIMLWVAAGIGGIWFSATRVFTRHIEAQYHDELYGHVRELAGLVNVSPDGHLTLTRPLSDPRYLEPMSGFYWQVSVWHGDVLRSASMRRGGLDEDVAHSPEVFHAVDNGPTGAAISYGFTRPAPDGRIIHYVISTDKRFLDAAIAGFTRELTLWLSGLAIALMGTGWAAIVFSLKPLDRLARAIADLRGGRREPLPGTFPREISPLVDDLNAFIVENQAIIARARVQAGNLAHSLRTPLAVITDEAEHLAASPAGDEAGRNLLAQTDIMVQQIEFHLARARSAAMAKTSGQTSQLPGIFEPLINAMSKLHPEVDFVLRAGEGVTATVEVDPIDLSEVLSILLDNAGKWADSSVVIDLAADGQDCVITITDDGPGMSAEQIAGAFGIGVRYDLSRPGSGLGLAIAREIAEAYGFDLTLAPAPTRGLAARLAVRMA
ncbi:HAMP domain-containing histidine kinase [Novosphingobium flavum]|uniref:histidine kinase n=1 Tax=Novosphingobium flavum TaxID=1778672 RepID=A0A7X1FVK1_9SPHN|nr:HAMP domain-containing sensor histidine kinase [Novosphingobium flavum]MBC2667177.1 HAMP domain-containing histidine kinase [Novosphingobium flavum]